MYLCINCCDFGKILEDVYLIFAAIVEIFYRSLRKFSYKDEILAKDSLKTCKKLKLLNLTKT